MTRETKMLAALLGVSGVLHFAIPKPYTAIVPKPLPYKRELVYASGVVELGCAAMLTQPRTRRLGGLLSFGLLLAVFPANIQMTIDVVQAQQVAHLVQDRPPAPAADADPAVELGAEGGSVLNRTPLTAR